jgi:hypothetical protein
MVDKDRVKIGGQVTEKRMKYKNSVENEKENRVFD